MLFHLCGALDLVRFTHYTNQLLVIIGIQFIENSWKKPINMGDNLKFGQSVW